MLMELVADLRDHLASRGSDRFDQHAGEQVGQRRADKTTGQRQRVDDVEARGKRIAVVVERVHERRQQRQRGQRSRTNREAFSDRGGGVADRVQFVRNFSHFRFKIAHLADAARIVRDRSVGVD